MVSYIGPPNSYAVGTFEPGTGGSPGTVTASSFPLQDFIEGLGDFPDAQIITTLPGTAEDYENGVPPGVLFTIGIDLDGDGVIEYDVRPVTGENQAELRVDEQISGNIGFYDGEFGIFPVGSDEPAVTMDGRVFITTDPDGFTQDVPMQIVPTSPPVLDVDEVPIVCFTRGTLIDTPDGPRRIEDLCVGDLVTTKDRGAQPILWISSRRIAAAWLAARPELRPVRIPAGALGKGFPAQDLVVSPQHRIALSSPTIRALFDEEEVLVRAKLLIGHGGIAAEPAAAVEYFHFMLEHHELVWANGALTETMLAGPMALKALGPEQCRELALFFPEIEMPTFVPAPARRILKRGENKRVLSKHRKHADPLYQESVAARLDPVG